MKKSMRKFASLATVLALTCALIGSHIDAKTKPKPRTSSGRTTTALDAAPTLQQAPATAAPDPATLERRGGPKGAGSSGIQAPAPDAAAAEQRKGHGPKGAGGSGIQASAPDADAAEQRKGHGPKGATSSDHQGPITTAPAPDAAAQPTNAATPTPDPAATQRHRGPKGGGRDKELTN